ncbi:MAG: hypothetical protein AAFX81_10895 [Pseudomonadota bacterium]
MASSTWVVGVAAALGIAAATAEAQTWRVSEGLGTSLFALAPPSVAGNRYAPLGIVCEEPGVAPRLDAESNHLYRPIEGLDLVILPDAFPSLRFSLPYDSASGPPPGGIEAQVSVDGRLLFRAGMDYDEIWSELYEPIAANDPLVAALKRGSRATVRIAGQYEATVSLRGSSRVIDTVLARCGLRDAEPSAGIAAAPAVNAAPPPAAQPGVAGPPSDLDARLAADFGPGIYQRFWFPSSDGTRALAVVYREVAGHGNSAILDIGLYRSAGSGWTLARVVSGVYGAEPRDVRFGSERVEITMTTLRPGEPRCCPTGTTRYAIDLATGAGRPL